jgi:DNA-binding CsgD family transcriptional regulator
MADPIALVEAAYANAATEGEWLEGLARASSPMIPRGQGLFAFIYDTRDPEWVNLSSISVVGIDPSFANALLVAPIERGVETRAMVRIFRSMLVTTARKELGRTPPILREQFAGVLAASGLSDARVVNATDPSRMGVAFVAPTVDAGPWSAREVRLWSRLAAHVAAGFRIHRLRRQLATVQADGSGEAILRPDGHLEHAEGVARGERARSALRRSVLALERARGPLRRRDGDGALALWEGLVAGRWSLVDHFDSDGRRYLVAHRNDPDAPDLRGLTLRERQVVGYAGAAHSNKIIAYELGLTLSTVAGHLARARAKLALPSLAAIREMLAVLPMPSHAAAALRRRS